MTADFFQLIGSLFRILKELFKYLGGASTQRNSKRNSTGNASWGVGPNTENSKRNSTGNVCWGGTTK